MKKMAVIAGCLGFALSLAGCSWEVPEKISVKTNAEYNFALGNLEKDLNSELNMSSLLGDVEGSNSMVTRYDYFPGKENKNVQHFLAEVKVVEYEVMSAAEVNSTFPNLENIPLSALSIPANLHDKVPLDFSPVEILRTMNETMKTDVIGKVNFSNVPLYLYYEALDGLTATAKIELFYGSKTTPVVERASTKATVYDDTITYCARPEYSYADNTVLITDLSKKSNSVTVDITDIMNAATSNTNVQPDDQLCIEYNISSISANGGTIAKSLAQNGIKIAVYALIDIPLSFDILDDINMDLSQLTGNLTGGESITSTTAADSTGSTGSSSSNEFTKYLEVVDSISIKYLAYKLPLYVNKKNGIKLGIDAVGRGKYEYANIYTVKEGKEITDSDYCTIDLRQDSIQRIKDFNNFSPKFQLKMEKDAVFSVPRDKALKVNIELSLKTDGTVEVK